MTATDPVTDGVPITIDGASVQARPGELLIDAAERNGVYIPRFCYHPRMSPVGMCRMCLVEVDTGRGAALQPACMLPCTPEMIVDTTSEVTKKAQDGVLEFLLINHPLDCPVCDKGGECPLQDQTMAFGPGETRFVEEKRHYEKPIAISDTVYLDRERCILCDRCTRFAKEVAGDPLIHFIDRGNETQVNTFPDDPFASYFSGNTVQICPVGALTAKPYRFKARPWDLEEIASTCVTSPTGDGIVIQSSRNEVLRYLGRDVDAVNWGWLGDKDRFGFEAITHPERLDAPLMRGTALGALEPDGPELVATRWPTALAAAVDAIVDGLAQGGPEGFAVIGGARLTNEEQYAWVRLAKGVIGSDNVDAQLGDGLDPSVVFGYPRATINEACEPGGTIVLLGPDPKEGFGSLYLRLRHAVVHDGATLIEITPRATALSRYAAVSLQHRPGESAAVIEAALAGSSIETAGVPAEALRLAGRLLATDGPVSVIVGRPSLADRSEVTAAALGALDRRPGGIRLLSALRRGNVHGALDMGMVPGYLPGRARRADASHRWSARWPTTPASDGLDTEGILRASADGKIHTLVLLGADPMADFVDGDLARRGLDGAGTVIAVDQFLTTSSSCADIVLPAAGAAEVDGTFTNLEGRISAVRAKVTPPGMAWSDWMIAAELARRLDRPFGDDVSAASLWAEVVATSELHAGVDLAAVDADAEGILLPGDPSAPAGPTASPELPGRDQWTFRLVVTHRLYDQGTLLQHCVSSAGLTPEPVVALSPHDLDTLGISEGGKVKVTSAEGTITGVAEVDPGLPRGSVGLVANLAPAAANQLIDASAPVTDVQVETA